MAMSLPLLATSCGGSKDIVVDKKTGLLHPPPDQEAVSGELPQPVKLCHV